MGDGTINGINTQQLTKVERETLLKAQNNKCACCGKPLGDTATNIDHIMPKAVYKWLETRLEPHEQSELRNLTLSINNVAIVHKQCNVFKSSVIPKYYDIDKLYTSNENKDKYKKTLDKCEKYIRKFKTLKTRVYNRQNRECHVCGRKLNYNLAIIRRLDNRKLRNERNAVLVCGKCNHCISDLRRKR